MRRWQVQAWVVWIGCLCSGAPYALANDSLESAALADAPRCIAVVGTNDLHGAIEPYVIAAQESSVQMGGVLTLGSYVQRLRETYQDKILLLDAGDMFQGTLPSNMSQGKVVIDAYNWLKYDAAAVGNHEFDYGALPNNPDKISVLKQRIQEAAFPFLTLNIFDAASGKRVDWPNTAPSILKTVGGIKVGIIGVSTPETPNSTMPANVATLVFKQPSPLVQAEAEALREKGAELVVLVTHMGGLCRDLTNPNNVASCQQQGIDGELLRLLQGLPKGLVDVAIGGHTHQFIAHWVNGTATLESGSRGQYVGWVEACVAKQGKGIDRQRSVLHAATKLCLTTWNDQTCNVRKFATEVSPAQFLGQPVELLPKLQQVVKPYLAAVEELGSKFTGIELPEALSVPKLADLAAEALRRSAQADFGMQNLGGIRMTLPPGKLNYANIFAVVPFDNSLVKVQLTGEQIAKLAKLLKGYHPTVGLANLHFAATENSASQVLRTSHGEELKAKQLYTVAITDYIASGGNKASQVLGAVPAERFEYMHTTLRDSFTAFLLALYPEAKP